MFVFMLLHLLLTFLSVLMREFIGNGILGGNIAAASGIIAAIPITFFGSLYWVFKK